jgi:hypothetical protein
MSFLDSVQTNTRERIALSPGSYGTGKEAGLKIVSYSEKGSKLDKSGAMRHSFLVAATRASREAQAVFNAEKSVKDDRRENGHQSFGPDFEGTAWLSLTLHEMWLNPEACALAFTEASRNKEGVIQADYIAAAIQEKEVTPESISKAQDYFKSIASQKVLDANTPDDRVQEAFETQYGKELTQIAIKVGQFVTLQDWSGKTRDLHLDPLQLVGTEFSGKVETKEFNGKSASEVTAVYSKSKAKAKLPEGGGDGSSVNE